MIKRILVPLDGSSLAEAALEYVEEISPKLGVEKVILISITERVQGYRLIEDPTTFTETRLEPEGTGKMEQQAEKYLKRVGQRLTDKGIKVETEVLLGDPAKEISIYAKSPGTDLVVMASHGRSGPSRWAHGSVADRVLRAVCTPVMVVRAPGCDGIL
jgi:nucleotide-binding universal stress UspA family protein